MEELGYLEGYEKNRYWRIRLPKSNFLITGSNWLFRLCWKILTLIMLIPLLVASKYYSQKLRPYSKDKENDVMTSYQYFTEIYPGCIYSPFVKGYELELFRNCNMDEPILEIGIGDGYFSSVLFKMKDKKLTYGADLIYGTIKSAMQYDHCEKFLIMDALEIPFPDNSMGTVIMNNLIHHLPDRSMVVEEVLRVLKRGGRFIFTDNLMGWGMFTWEQLLMRGLQLHSIADKILKFKLKLFAQKLLTDEYYYNKKSNQGKFRIITKINFVSKTSMYLSSIFEFLNLKQGQPTRREMIRWMNLFGLKGKINKYVSDTIKYCSIMDKILGETEGYSLQFFEIEKLGGKDLLNIKAESLLYVCPKCKEKLTELNNSYFCNHCNIKYPIVDGIPILVSYQNKLKGFYPYIEEKKKEKGEEYIT